KSRILDTLQLRDDSYLLMTLHRKENTDEKQRLLSILNGLAESKYPIVWPVHPRTKKRLDAWNISIPSTLRMIDPVRYLDMLLLEKHARLIATDSGGVQKEAYFHNVPCMTLRDETEWVELVEIGANKLVGANSEKIASALEADEHCMFAMG